MVLIACVAVIAGLLIVEGMVKRHGGGQRTGFASRAQLKRAVGAKQLLRRAAILRPSVTSPKLHDVGLQIARVGRLVICGSVEDSYLLLGPPRAGKGAGALIPWLLEYPGPVIVTSTRDDLIRATVHQRATRGAVWLFDPTAVVSKAVAGPAQRGGWSLLSGCEEPLTAILRARAIVAASRSSDGVRNADFWRGSSETVLRCFFHAAALGGLDVRSVREWVGKQSGTEALALLKDPRASDGWFADLLGITQMEEETRTNVFAGAQMSLTVLADPRVLEMVSAASAFDIDGFLRGCGTLYLVGPSDAQHSMAPIIVALIEAIVDRARRLAATMPGGRLDPPLGLFLDEAAQIAPLPSLPRLVADGGGTGITPIVVLQSLAQARDRWGIQAADTIWDACTVRLVLGGMGNDGDLQKLSRLCGEVDERVAAHGKGGSSVSSHKRAVISVAEIRGLKPWRALLLYKGLAPAVVTLTPYFKAKAHPRQDDASVAEMNRAA